MDSISEIRSTITSSFGPLNHGHGFIYIATLLARAQNPVDSRLKKRQNVPKLSYRFTVEDVDANDFGI